MLFWNPKIWLSLGWLNFRLSVFMYLSLVNLVCKPCQFWPNSFNQGCSTHVALQQGEIGWSNHQMVWEILRGEVGGFSRLETEFNFQVSWTPLWNLVSLQPGQIRLWHFNQSWRYRVTLQQLLLPLVPKLNGFKVKNGRRLRFQCIFEVVLLSS